MSDATPAAPGDPTRGRSPLTAGVRAPVWWAPKLLPVLAAASLAALAAEADPGPGLARLAAMVVSGIGLAAAMHLVNDWADIGADAAATKPNAAAGMDPRRRALLLATAYLLGIVPWAAIRPGWAAVGVLVVLVVLPLLYSVPPFRLKGRGILGVLADATNAHLAPTALAFLLMVEVGRATGAWTLAFVGGLAWSTGLGIRGILTHQVVDRTNDRIAHVGTYVVRRGRRPTVRLGWAALVGELVGLGAVLVAVAATAPWVAATFGLYLGLWLLDRRWAPRPFHPVPDRSDAWMPLVEFYEVWPVVLFSVALCRTDLAWWPLPIALGVGFAPVIAKQSRDLARIVGHVLHDARALLAQIGWSIVVAARRARVAVLRALWKIPPAANWLWWRLRNALSWAGWRVVNAVAWIGWRTRNAVAWIWWHPINWIWWHPINWIWWHPLGWVRFRVIRWIANHVREFAHVAPAAARRRLHGVRGGRPPSTPPTRDVPEEGTPEPR